MVVNDFSHVSKVELSWIFRLYVSAYREIRRVEFIDERLILKNVPCLIKYDVEKINRDTYNSVWLSSRMGGC